MTGSARIAGAAIGPGNPVFVIAEAGVNHGGSVESALELVAAASTVGADAVKFQTYSAERVASPDAALAPYQGSEGSQLDLLRRLELAADEFALLARAAAAKGIVFLSTPFDVDSADMLEDLGVPAFKLSSGDLTNLPLVEHVAGKRKPVILSTGMADLNEVARAHSTAVAAGAEAVVILHCTSAYPADPRDANLRALHAIGERTGAIVGLSDHTRTPEVAVAAVALGACVIEKHLTLDRGAHGPDHAASLEPHELKDLIASIRIVESALGDGVKRPAAAEQPVRAVARRSLAAGADLAAGVVLEAAMLTALRPGSGIGPDRLDEVVGRRLRRALRRGELISAADLE